MSYHRFSYNSLQPSTFALIFIGDSGSHPVILSGGAACAYPPAQHSPPKVCQLCLTRTFLLENMILRDTTRLFRIFLITCILLLPCTAATPEPSSEISATFVPPDREIVVATKEAPPFAMKEADGNWQAISIDLWRRVADQIHLRYRFMEVATVQDLLDATSKGAADASVAAITVTAARARTSDFTQPFLPDRAGCRGTIGCCELVAGPARVSVLQLPSGGAGTAGDCFGRRNSDLAF